MDTKKELPASRTGSGEARREIKTIVFTDIVDCVQLKQNLGDETGLRLIFEHHELVRQLLKEYPGGREVKTAGDSFLLVFNSASDAVRFSIQLQSGLRQFSKKAGYRLQDRVGINVGEILDQVVDIHGMQVDMCSRVNSLAGAGQIFLTRSAFEHVQEMLKHTLTSGAKTIQWVHHGQAKLKGINDPIDIFQVGEPRATDFHRPPNSEKVEWLDETKTEAASGHKIRPWLAAASTGALGLLLVFSSFFKNLSYDLSYVAKLNATPAAYTNDVEFVMMDDDSKTDLKQKSLRDWDRRYHAQLIDWLTKAGAKAIAFDIVFQQSRPEEDPLFLKAITNSGRVAVAIGQRKDANTGFSKSMLDVPFDELLTNAWCGLTESGRKADQTIRNPQFGKDPGVAKVFFKSLAEELVEKLGDKRRTADSRAWFNYYCPPTTIRIPTRSYSLVLSNHFQPNLFTNKVVFIGGAASTSNIDEPQERPDEFKTSYSLFGHQKMPGVMANATSYLNLKRGDWLTQANSWCEALLVILIGVGAGYGMLLLTPIQAVAAGLAGSGLITASLILQTWHTGIWFVWIVPCLIQIPFAMVWSVLNQSRRLASENRRLQNTLVSLRTRVASRTSIPQQTPQKAYENGRTVKLNHFEIPDHKLIKIIGEGSYGQVWLASDVIGSYHAVKILQRAAFTEERPYEREFHGLQRFTPISRMHPGLVQILHVGRNDEGGFMYYIMEAGDDEQNGQQINPANYQPRNLSRDLDRLGVLTVKETVALAISLAEALQFLHTQGLIHRDIKPANIIFVHGHPKLADIGLVTEMAGTNLEVSFIGTVGYAAPEGPGSAAADIYSLGKLMYVASTGCSAQQFPDIPSSLAQRADAEDILLLNNLILKACEPIVKRRYQNTAALLEDLQKLKIHLG